jgi:hypothetical protein
MENVEEIQLLNHQVHILIHSKVDQLYIQQNLYLLNKKKIQKKKKTKTI